MVKCNCRIATTIIVLCTCVVFCGYIVIYPRKDVVQAPTSIVAHVPDITGKSARGSDRSDEGPASMVDPEHRTKPLDESMGHDAFDLTALAGMPKAYGEILLNYTQAVSEAIRPSPLTRRRFYHKEVKPAFQDNVTYNPSDYEYPDGANPIYDRDVVVPLVLLPRPESVRTWSASTEARALGWRSEESVIENRGSVYGRTVIFQPGKLSVNPSSFPASPFEADIPSAHLYVMVYETTYFLDLGKVVLTPHYELTLRGGGPLDRLAVLRLGEEGGAQLLGELITVPPYLKNNRLRWVSIGDGSNVRRFLAYSLLDGNGARRMKISEGVLTSSRISPYVRPLVCDQHQPKIKQHDTLLLPTPMRWPPNLNAWVESHGDNHAHEEWCLDDWFPAQKDACWVIREADDSKPLQESFLLMSASEESDRPVFFVALFAETEPKQLVKELAALYKVSADTALNSPETMERLNSLYEKVRDFPLTK